MKGRVARHAAGSTGAPEQQQGPTPAVGARVQLLLPDDEQPWDAVVHAFTPPDQHVLQFDGCIYRQLQLSPGSWSIHEDPDAAPALAAPSEQLATALQLLNRTLLVWLDGAAATEALVLAYRSRTREHLLQYSGAVHLCNLQQQKWELLEAGTSTPAAAASAGTGSTAGQQRKRKPPASSGRPTRARPQPEAAADAAAADTDTDASAVVSRAATDPAGQHDIAAKATDWVPTAAQAVAAAAAAAAVAALLPAAQAAVAAVETAAAPHPAAVVQEGAGRPQRSRQASKRLTLPGEEEPSGQQQLQQQLRQQQHPVKPLVAGRGAGDAGGAGDAAGAERQQEQQHQCWPSDGELLQAAAAAGVPCLDAGVGLVSWGSSDSGSGLQVSLEAFMLGNPISCHLTALKQHPGAAKLRLCQQVADSSSGRTFWRELSQACHDCRQPHIPHTCQRPGCDIKASVCNRCLLQHYHTLYSLPELLRCCPRCRQACACSSCLAEADPAQLAPPLQCQPQQQARQAQYVLQGLLPLLRDMLQQQQAEAAAWGYSSLQEVPQSPLDLLVRPLCDRCATQIAGVAATCSQCGWDYCCECAAALRQHAQAEAAAAAVLHMLPPGAPDAAAAAEAAGSVQRVQVTCCNPECSRQGCSMQSEQCQHPEGAPQQQWPQQRMEGVTGGQVASATDRDDGSSQQWDSRAAEGQQEAEAACVVRQQLFGLPGTPGLQLQLVLPPDLLQGFQELQELAKSGALINCNTGLQLQDCPLLDSADLQLLHSCRPIVPGSEQHVTLQHLQSPTWWQNLPQGLQHAWRRSAAVPGWRSIQQQQRRQQQQGEGASIPQQGPAQAQHPGSNSSSSGGGPYLFTPTVGQLHGAGPQGLLARLVFWARWRLGEPIVVRGVKGTVPWDPHTLERAMGSRSSSGSSNRGDKDLQVLDCADFSTVTVTHRTFFSGYLHGRFAECQTDGRLQQQQHTDGQLQQRLQTDGQLQQQLQTDGRLQQQCQPVMYKLKDYPASVDIQQKLRRHYADFLSALPLRCYTEPRLGIDGLNLATSLLPRDNCTDLGPKVYMAYGRVAETEGEGDSVTKLHLDMTDAVNLLLDTAPGGDPAAQQLAQQQQQRQQQQQSAAVAAGAAADGQQQQQQARCGDQEPQLPGYQGAGAVWDIWGRAALQPLNAYLAANAAGFRHMGCSVLDLGDPLVTHSPVLSQAYMLTQTHRHAFLDFVQQVQQQAAVQSAEQPAVQLWHFEQYDGEAVFIPGGCPHQVRNLKSCCKVAADFVSPENLWQALAHKGRLRAADLSTAQPLGDGPHDRHCQEKLQSQLMLLRGTLRAARTLQGVGGSAAAAAAGGGGGGS